MKNIISKLFPSFYRIILLALFILISTFSFITIMKAADSIPSNLLSDSALIASYQFNGNFNDSTKNNIVTIKNQKDLIVDSKNLLLKNSYDYDPRNRANFILDTTGISLLTIESLNYYTNPGMHTISGIGIYDSSGTGSIDVRHNYLHNERSSSWELALTDHVYLLQSNNKRTSELLSLSFNIWIKETIVIDYINKTVDYYRDKQNGSQVEHIKINDINLKKDKNTTISFTAWDWATGSTHLVDYLNIYAKQQMSYTPCNAPKEGDFNISQSCTLNQSVTVPANINIKNGAKLFVNTGAILFFDLKKYKLIIEKNSGVLIHKNASIRQLNNNSAMLSYLDQVNGNIEKLSIDQYIETIKFQYDKLAIQVSEFNKKSDEYRKKFQTICEGYGGENGYTALMNNWYYVRKKLDQSPDSKSLKDELSQISLSLSKCSSDTSNVKSLWQEAENNYHNIERSWENIKYNYNQALNIKSAYDNWKKYYADIRKSLIDNSRINYDKTVSDIELVSKLVFDTYSKYANNTTNFWVESGNQARAIAQSAKEAEVNDFGTTKYLKFSENLNKWRDLSAINTTPSNDLKDLANTINAQIAEFKPIIENNSLIKDKFQADFTKKVEEWNKTDWQSKTALPPAPIPLITSINEPTLYQGTKTLTGASTESNTPTLQYSQNSQYGQGFYYKNINNNIQIDECNSSKEKSIICSIGTIVYYTKESLFGSYCIYNNETKIGIINKNDFENYKKSITNNTCHKAGIPIKAPEKYTFGNDEYVFWQWSNGAKFDGLGYSYVLTNEEINNYFKKEIGTPFNEKYLRSYWGTYLYEHDYVPYQDATSMAINPNIISYFHIFNPNLKTRSVYWLINKKYTSPDKIDNKYVPELLGYPKSNKKTENNIEYQEFENGIMFPTHFNAKSIAVSSYIIYGKWKEAFYRNGGLEKLGYPISDVKTSEIYSGLHQLFSKQTLIQNFNGTISVLNKYTCDNLQNYNPSVLELSSAYIDGLWSEVAGAQIDDMIFAINNLGQTIEGVKNIFSDIKKFNEIWDNFSQELYDNVSEIQDINNNNSCNIRKAYLMGVTIGKITNLGVDTSNGLSFAKDAAISTKNLALNTKNLVDGTKNLIVGAKDIIFNMKKISKFLDEISSIYKYEPKISIITKNLKQTLGIENVENFLTEFKNYNGKIEYAEIMIEEVENQYKLKEITNIIEAISETASKAEREIYEGQKLALATRIETYKILKDTKTKYLPIVFDGQIAIRDNIIQRINNIASRLNISKNIFTKFFETIGYAIGGFTETYDFNKKIIITSSRKISEFGKALTNNMTHEGNHALQLSLLAKAYEKGIITEEHFAYIMYSNAQNKILYTYGGPTEWAATSIKNTNEIEKLYKSLIESNNSLKGNKIPEKNINDFNQFIKNEMKNNGYNPVDNIVDLKGTNSFLSITWKDFITGFPNTNLSALIDPKTFKVLEPWRIIYFVQRKNNLFIIYKNKSDNQTKSVLIYDDQNTNNIDNEDNTISDSMLYDL